MKIKLLTTTDVNLERIGVATELGFSYFQNKPITIEKPLTPDFPIEQWINRRVTFCNQRGEKLFSFVPQEVTPKEYMHYNDATGVLMTVNAICVTTRNNRHVFYTENLRLQQC